MIRTLVIPCPWSHALCDSLNRESARIYNATMVWHYRIYRKKGVWLSPNNGCKLSDRMIGSSFLHAHSIDAAQQQFYRSCKSARRSGGKYPHKRPAYRPTVWKYTAIRCRGDRLLFSLGRGQEPLVLHIPGYVHLENASVREARLVYNRLECRYYLHLVVEYPSHTSYESVDNVIAVDLGEIHPVTAADLEESVVFCARELRSTYQGMARRLASIQYRQSRHRKGSRRYRRLQTRKRKVLAKTRRKVRDILHKVSRAFVDYAVSRRVRTVVVGDIRSAARGKRFSAVNQQKLSLWAHGILLDYIRYKLADYGIDVVLLTEAYTSQTCPRCGHRHKPRGRVFRCPSCGFCVHRDAVGAMNLLSLYLYSELARIAVSEVKYRHPYVVRGKRSSPGHGASGSLRRETSAL